MVLTQKNKKTPYSVPAEYGEVGAIRDIIPNPQYDYITIAPFLQTFLKEETKRLGKLEVAGVCTKSAFADLHGSAIVHVTSQCQRQRPQGLNKIKPNQKSLH